MKIVLDINKSKCMNNITLQKDRIVKVSNFVY